MPPTFGVQSRDPKIFLPIIKYIVTCKRPYWPTIGIGATNIPYYIKVRHRDILPARLNSTPPWRDNYPVTPWPIIYTESWFECMCKIAFVKIFAINKATSKIFCVICFNSETLHCEEKHTLENIDGL